MKPPGRRVHSLWRTATFLLLALLAHAGLLALPGTSSTRKAPRLRRVQLVARPSVVATPSAPNVLRPVAPPPPSSSSSTPPLLVTRAEQVASAPSVNLFPRNVIEDVARNGPRGTLTPDGPDLSGVALAEARLDRLRDAVVAYQRGADGPTPALTQLGDELATWFTPEPDQLARAGRFGVGVASLLESYLRRARNFALNGADGSAPAMQRLDSLLAAPGAQAVTLCFGLCHPQTHQVAELFVVIDIDHDQDGKPVAWRVAESSGQANFDADALSALAYVTEHVLRPTGNEAPTARWSRWALAAQAFYYHRAELIADPLFVPPGREIEEASGVLGKSTFTRQVWLVAVRYEDSNGSG